jgi:hypothetical protein
VFQSGYEQAAPDTPIGVFLHDALTGTTELIRLT